MSKLWLYIANWKSYLAYQQELSFFKQDLTELQQLAVELKIQNKKLVICPSFITLAQISEILDTQNISSIKLGAQNCSATELGAYTGEISAKSLQELGCNYCLVGHAERRKFFYETELELTAKIKLLIQAKIVPIICISDAQQLINILADLTLEDLAQCESSFIIAYEPNWAIGTGKVPTNSEISQFCQAVQAIIKTKYNNCLKSYFIIYGGSVTANNISELQQITELNGVLIGKASINFQELKKIVLS